MVQKVKINKVFSNPVNPRTIKEAKFKKLVNSIKEFPEMLKLRPIVVNEEMGILGGNMRYKACQKLGHKEIYIIKAENLTEKQKESFVIKDNVGFGDWDWDVLANSWDTKELTDWGMDVWQSMEDLETSDEFSLPDGDKEPFQKQTFTLADTQVEQIKNAIADIKKTEEYKYVETFGNENGNGNALYLIIMQWVEQKK
jgi:hypothetical protein